MMKRNLWLLVIGLMLGGCSSDTTEEFDTGNIAGSVFDQTTGEPVATVNVTLTPSGKSTVTGSDGSFLFVDLAPGTYTVDIRKEGYKDNSRSVDVVAGQSTEAHLTIERIPASLTSDRKLLDFGENLTTLSFAIVNSGYTNLTYEVEIGDCQWLSVNPKKDILSFGQTATIVVNVDRGRLPNGANEANIIVRSTNGNGNVEIKVTATNNAMAALNTLDVTNITNTTATLNGEIINTGTPAYTERGFVIDTQPIPTISTCLRKVSSPVTSNKQFSCNINELSPTQTYYARAYLVQSGETIYGNIISFSTSQQITVVSTSAVTEIGATTATFNASIADVGAPGYTERGFCYSTNSIPTIVDNRKRVSGSEAGAFSLRVTNLEYPVTYYVRAYAIQAGNTVYGNIVTFSTYQQSTAVVTSAATEISSSSALLNGAIIRAGEPVYSEKGFCLSTGYTASISDIKIIVNGSDAGNFSARINRLDYDSRYCFRAYAIQNGVPVYGDVAYFYTAYIAPAVTTSDISNINYTSATFNGTITTIGDPIITERGFCYCDNANTLPTIADKTVKVSGVTVGAFKVNVTDLEEWTSYSVRAYVIQDGKPIYGNVKKFETYYTPDVVTGPPASVSTVSSSIFWKATFQGFFWDGNPQVTEVGFVYSILSGSTTVDTGTKVQATSVDYQSKNQGYLFRTTISNLSPYYTYYYRAYAKTSFGYTYGEVQSFTTN